MIRALLLTLFSIAVSDSHSLADEKSYSAQKCAENEFCKMLKNGKADYNLEGKVLRVVDGDTIEVKLFVLPGLTYDVKLRPRSINAPEIRNTKCDEEKEFGEYVAKSIAGKFPVGSWVRVTDVESGKYSGRLLASVERWRSDRFIPLAEDLRTRVAKWGDHPQGVDSDNYDWCEALKANG